MQLFLKNQNKIRILSTLTKKTTFPFSQNNSFSKTKFADLEFLRADIKTRLSELNLTHLTRIQDQSFPTLLKKTQTFIMAETGSGKTLTYLLPIVNSLYNDYNQPKEAEKTPRGALILTSSKELTSQIFVDLKRIDNLNKLQVTRLGTISQMATNVKHMVG